MRFLLSTIGTAGDVHPFVAIGLALKRRGHDVVVAANPHFAERITRYGLTHEPVGTEEEYRQLVTHPGLVGGLRGPAYVLFNLIVPAVGAMAAAMKRAHAAAPLDAVCAHFICFGAPRIAEQLGIPCATCVLAPMFWNSRHDRPRWPGLPPNLPGWVDRPMRKLMRAAASVRFDPAVNRQFDALGVPRSRSFVVHEARGENVDARGRVRGPARPALGLWSTELRPRRDDDPERGRICGFTWFDRAQSLSGPDEQSLRAFMGEGGPPVVVTLGSSVVHHGQDVYALAREACRRVGRRVVLLGARDGRADDGQDGVYALGYAPYSRVLPHGCCTVHHGGIGTTAQSMRAGVPSVIIPFANDEFDNAARAAACGVSVTLRRRELGAESLAAAIKRACSDAALVGTARIVGKKLLSEDGAETAADELEKMAAVARVHRLSGRTVRAAVRA